VLLLISEAKYKFVFTGERRPQFWMRNSKTSYRMNILRQTIMSRSMLLTCETPSEVNRAKIKSFPALLAVQLFMELKKLSETTWSTHEYTYALLFKDKCQDKCLGQRDVTLSGLARPGR